MAKIDCYNVFQQLLLRYIHDYHPYMEEDKEEMTNFIVERASLAAKAHTNAFYAGKNSLEREEEAWKTLYTDLEFSPITYLIEVGMDNYCYEMDKEEAVEIYRNPAVRTIFAKYPKNIEGDPKEYLLVEELMPFLKKHEGKGEDVEYKHINVF